MNKLFRLHDYLGNMKARIDNFSIKGKLNIWWEFLKNVRGIREEDLTWSQFKRLFKKKYLSKIYYDDTEKDFYELKMRSITNEEYASRFLEFLRYVPYIKEEKEKNLRFINGFLVSFKENIEFDEARFLEEAIRNLKQCYAQSKRNTEYK